MGQVATSNSVLEGVVVVKDKIIRVFGQQQILRKKKQLDFIDPNQIRAKLRFLARLENLVSEKK